LAALSYIFDIGRLDKGVDPCKVRQFSPAEGGNSAVLNGRGARKTQLKSSSYFFFILGGRQQSLRFDGVLRFRTIVVVQWNFASIFAFVSQNVTSLLRNRER
jgi:hypothetical protein